MDFEFYKKKMEIELYNFIVIWLVVLLSLTYCYNIVNKIAKGFKRFSFISPFILLFLYLPFYLYLIHLNFYIFLFIFWLANFKLLFLSFGNGMLLFNPSVSLSIFQALISLPIKIRRNESHPSGKNSKNESKLVLYLIKIPILAIVMYITTNHIKYNYSIILIPLTCLQYYLTFEMTLTIISTLVGSLLGLGLEPNFNEPYLSTSLQDFWGRRWNIVTSYILRVTIHQPMKNALKKTFGHRWATPLAVVTTFSVSGIMHEAMWYQMLRENPSGEVMLYFVLHGVCVAMEIEVKKRFVVKKWYFPLLSCGLTLGFVLGTTSWLLFAPFKRVEAHVRILYEYGVVMKFVRDGFGF